MMRVLYLDHTSLVSGAQRALLDLVTGLPKAVQATLMCPPGQLADMAREAGCQVLEYAGTAGSLRLHPVHTPRAVSDIASSARALRRTADELEVDLIHANSIRAALIASCARLTGGPPLVAH